MLKPERWQQVKDVFDAALQCSTDERGQFLDKMCGEDKLMLAEVESLLSSFDNAESFMEENAVAYVADSVVGESGNLENGKSFGHYEIVRRIGAGGMGVVYLAEDTKLERNVAIKVLNEKFGKDESNLKRFIQEARAASALNHPNILVIHEIGELEKTNFIVSEYVEGETLREIIKEKNLSFAEILDVSIQIANALNAAHSAYIIHRDIKPENIIVRPDGYVKILDFGLAKLIERKNKSFIGLEKSIFQQNETAKGMILGTVNYMSPEQAKGERIDERTDIFSLGAVIYEMIAGITPFAGETMSETFANLIKIEPLPLVRYAANVPDELQQIIAKTLRKNKDERYQTMCDLLIDLKELREQFLSDEKIERIASNDADATKLLPNPTADVHQQNTANTNYSFLRQIKDYKLLSVSSVLILIVVAAFGYYEFRGKSVDVHLSVNKTEQITNWSGLDFYPAISPDGNTIAFSSDRTGSFEIYVKQLVAGAKEIQITSDGAENFEPAFSPDGGKIAYFSNKRGGICFVPMTGGTPKQLTEFGGHPAWSPDGKTIAFSDSTYITDPSGRNANSSQTLWLVSIEGGEPRRLTQVGNPAGGHSAPSWSPDGKRIVFDTNDPSFSEVWSVSAQGDDLKKLSGNLVLATDAVYAPDGNAVFFIARLGSSIWQVNLSATGETVGEPVKIVDANSSRIRNLSIAAKTGRIAYSAMTLNSNLWSMSVTPSGDARNDETIHLTQSTNTRNVHPAFSPDGTQIAYAAYDGTGRSQIFTMNTDGRNKTQLTSVDDSFSPSWFPDGKQIAFRSSHDGQNNVSSVTIEGAKVTKLFDLDHSTNIVRLSPDGKRFAYSSTRNGGITNIWLSSTDGSEQKQLTFDKIHAAFPNWSPDGKWVVYGNTDNNGIEQTAIISSEGGEPVQLPSEKGQNFVWDWSPDSNKILFAGQRNDIWNLYWISRTTGQQKQLTNFTKLNTYVRYPAWSPSGTQIVYESAETTGNIWVADLK